MQQTIDCPIRGAWRTCPGPTTGVPVSATGWRCSAIRWPGCRRCTSRSRTSRLPAWALRLWCLFHPQAVQELMVDRRDDLQRWQPALCMLKQWNGRSFMMREAPPPRPAQRSTAAPGAAAGQRGSPPGREVGRAGGGGARIRPRPGNGCVQRHPQRSRAVRRRPATVGLSDRQGGAPAVAGGIAGNEHRPAAGPLVPEQTVPAQAGRWASCARRWVRWRALAAAAGGPAR